MFQLQQKRKERLHRLNFVAAKYAKKRSEEILDGGGIELLNGEQEEVCEEYGLNNTKNNNACKKGV